VRKTLGRTRRRLEAAVERGRATLRHRRIAAAPAASRGAVAVYYGHDRLPAPGERAHGGMVKFQQLQASFPNEPRDFSVLYLGSTTLPADASALIELARRRDAAVVWNQDGVAYQGWFGPGWEAVNEPLARGLHAADHVFFQSDFCRLSSDRFLGERTGRSEVLHNPVDTRRFTPGPKPTPDQPLTLLLAGNQYQRYRLEAALAALRLVRAEHPTTRLLVSGRLSWDADPRIVRREADEVLDASGVREHVELTGTYAQSDAPLLYRRADVLLHTKYNDPCPTAVLEAMACGVPVVYSASGGTPELVGGAAGIGVPAPLDWERDHPPEPAALAEATLQVLERHGDYAAAARERSLHFDLERWVERHRLVFEELVN
jgi:glycosyltransferase involved in cell wall biosynthesis